MPHTIRPKDKGPAKPKRPAHRPTKFTPELGNKICELIACGSLMKDAARHFGIPPETVSRWRVKHADFREAYRAARVLRTEVWAERCVEIADDASRDYTIGMDGNPVLNTENLHWARLQINARRWQMVRLDRRVWGHRQEIHVKDDCADLSEAERLHRAMQLLGVSEELVKPL